MRSVTNIHLFKPTHWKRIERNIIREKLSTLNLELKQFQQLKHGFQFRDITANGIKTVSGLTKNQLMEDCEKDQYINPLDLLQAEAVVPVLNDCDYLFKPTKDEIIQGEQFFVPKRGHTVEKLASVVDLEKLPKKELPEVDQGSWNLRQEL